MKVLQTIINNDTWKRFWRGFAYFSLSILAAVISIAIIVAKDNTLLTIFNILMPTLFCFIITTSYCVCKKGQPFMYTTLIATSICATFCVLGIVQHTHGTKIFPMIIYWIALIFAVFMCIYYTYILEKFSREQHEKAEKLDAMHDAEEKRKESEKLIEESKQQPTFSQNGENYIIERSE